MRIKVLALFVAIQILSLGLWQQVSGQNTTVEMPVSAIHAASDALFENMSFTSRNREGNITNASPEVLEGEIKAVFAQLPANHVSSVKNVILDYSSTAYRGLGGKQMIILRSAMAYNELAGVFIHELGHNVDLITIHSIQNSRVSEFKDGQTPVFEDDLSLDFYRISWMNEITRKKTATNFDFVSGYAMTDPFEDFAETYVYYVLHNRDFKALTATNAALAAKYNFMHDVVFEGQDFDTGNSLVATNRRSWDVTVLPYNLDNFLN